MKNLFDYFWVLMLAVNGLNASILWMQVQTYIHKNPKLRPGYIKLIRGFYTGMSVPWIFMGFNKITGKVSHIGEYFYPRAGNQFVIGWWVSIWTLLFMATYWVWFRGGAEKLIEYPGLFKGKPSNPQFIKIMYLLLLIGNMVGTIVIFSISTLTSKSPM
jgi:hypothetical protein